MTKAKKVWITIGIALGAPLLAFGLWYGGHMIKRATADTRGTTGQVEAISANATYRIAKYNYFFDLCASVETKEDEIALTESALEAKGLSDYRIQQLNTNLLALQSSRADTINQYNAEASKADTAANFQASELPYKLDVDKETTCAQ